MRGNFIDIRFRRLLLLWVRKKNIYAEWTIFAMLCLNGMPIARGTECHITCAHSDLPGA